MKIGDRTCLLCQCEGTLPLDAAALGRAFGTEPPRLAHQLCRAELQHLREQAPGEPLLVGCTQEVAILGETLAEAAGEGPAPDVVFANIRERAGWSAEGARAAPKVAALLAEAAMARPPAPSVALHSEGVALILGRDEAAIEAARQLAGDLDVTVLLSRPGAVLPPRTVEFPVLKGTVRQATGHLGAFEVVVDDYAAPRPSSRAALEFGPARDGARARCDVLLDLTGDTPLVPAAHARDGYLRADPGSPAAVLDAVLRARDLKGDFDKPRYVNLAPDLCAHSRNGRTGCTRCLDVCPTGAIVPDGDHVAIDPYVCAGCGHCSAVCPTGAATYAQPVPFQTLERLRVLLSTYREAGGRDAVLLLHDAPHGAPMIEMLARLGPGLPARVIPVEVGEVTSLGIEAFSTAVALGAAEVRVLAPRRPRHDMGALHGVLDTVGRVLEAQGFGEGRCGVIETDDPDELGAFLYGLPARPGVAALPPPLPFGDKRALMKRGLAMLHAVAPEPVDVVALAPGAPFGRIEVDVDGCTMCFSCFNVCPTAAIREHPDKPQLSFVEDACVQCGLCANTCPEDVITLVARIDLTEAALVPVVLKEEEPARCIRCDKAFGVKSTIERVIAKLADKHWMYSGPNSPIDRMRMCADCRVTAHVEAKIDPYAGPPRPRPTTAADFPRKS